MTGKPRHAMTKHTQRQKLLQEMKRGWVTSLDAALKYGCLYFMTRVSEFKRQGLRLDEKVMTTASGTRIKAYRLSRSQPTVTCS
jgi:ribosomal protein L20